MSAHANRRDRGLPPPPRKTRLLVWLILLLVVPAGIVGFALDGMERALTGGARTALSGHAHAIASAMTREIGLSRRLLDSLAQMRPSWERALEGDDLARERLRRAVATFDLVDWVAFQGPGDRQLILGPGRERAPGTLPGELPNAECTACLVHPLDDGARLVLRLDLGNAFDHAGKSAVADAELLMLVSRRGRVLAVSGPGIPGLSVRPGEGTAFLRNATALDRVQHLPLLGQDALVIRTDIGLLPMQVVVLTRQQATVAIAADLRQRLLIGAAVFMLMGVAAAFLSWGRMRRFDRAMRRMVALQTAVFSGSSALILIVDADGVVQSINPAAERLTGLESGEVCGKLLLAAMLTPHQSGRGRDRVTMRNVLDTARRLGTTAVELDLTGGGPGQGHTLLTTVTALQEDEDRPASFVIVGTDITERLEQETLKNDFISTISHELRTPLTSIRGSLGLMLMSEPEEPISESRDLLHIAESNCERLIGLINDILDIERLSTGQLDIRPDRHALATIVEETVEANRPAVEADGGRIECSLPEATVDVIGDAERIAQVLTNLISNARKYGPPGGTIRVALTRSDALARVTVSDEGDGIPTEFRDRLFQRFSQADASSTRRQGGVGLGLAISRGLMARMGGRIDVDDAATQGTHFFFELPCYRNADTAPAGELPAVRICDEDAERSRRTQLALERTGYRCRSSDDVDTAAAWLAEEQFAALAVSTHIRGGTLAFLDRIRSLPGAAHLPTVVMVDDPEALEAASVPDGERIVDWLHMPLRESELVEAIARCTDRGGDATRILHIEDDPNCHEVVRRVVGDRARLHWAQNIEEGRTALHEGRYDAVLLDLLLPDGNAAGLLPEIQALEPPPPIIVFSAYDYLAPHGGNIARVLRKGSVSNEALVEAIESTIRFPHREEPGA